MSTMCRNGVASANAALHIVARVAQPLGVGFAKLVGQTSYALISLRLSCEEFAKFARDGAREAVSLAFRSSGNSRRHCIFHVVQHATAYARWRNCCFAPPGSLVPID